jgi:hypothetical protein
VRVVVKAVRYSTEIPSGLPSVIRKLGERCVHEWSLKENSGKPLFISRNGRAYKKISGVDLIKLKDKL